MEPLLVLLLVISLGILTIIVLLFVALNFSTIITKFKELYNLKKEKIR